MTRKPHGGGWTHRVCKRLRRPDGSWWHLPGQAFHDEASAAERAWALACEQHALGHEAGVDVIERNGGGWRGIGRIILSLDWCGAGPVRAERVEN